MKMTVSKEPEGVKEGAVRLSSGVLRVSAVRAASAKTLPPGCLVCSRNSTEAAGAGPRGSSGRRGQVVA